MSSWEARTKYPCQYVTPGGLEPLAAHVGDRG